MKRPACMPSIRRIADIERLRALAALGVMLGHVPWLQVGFSQLVGVDVDPWTGVDLFFVISGFVVSGAFERDLADAGGASPVRSALMAFYRKRTARIVPTAYLGILIWWVATRWWNSSGAWGTLAPAAMSGAALASVGFVANYAEAWWGVATPIVGFWSLCVEEHFYLVYSLFRSAVRTPARRALSLVTVVLVIQIWGALTGATRQWPGLSHVRFDQLAAGVLLRLARDRWPSAVAAWDARLRARGPARLAATSALIGLLVALAVLAVTWLDPTDEAAPFFVVGRVMAVLIPMAIVWLASSDADLLGTRVFGIGRALSAIGARSYAIYMFHMPAFLCVVELRARWLGGARPAWLLPAELAAFFAVLALATEANLRWVERPAIAWAARTR